MPTNKKSMTIMFYRIVSNEKRSEPIDTYYYKASKPIGFLDNLFIKKDELPEEIPNQIQVTIKFK